MIEVEGEPTIFFVVDRSQVEAMETDKVGETLRDTEHARSVWLVFDGYDDDPRDVWNIEEPCRWTRQLLLDNPGRLTCLKTDVSDSRVMLSAVHLHGMARVPFIPRDLMTREEAARVNPDFLQCWDEGQLLHPYFTPEGLILGRQSPPLH